MVFGICEDCGSCKSRALLLELVSRISRFQEGTEGIRSE